MFTQPLGLTPNGTNIQLANKSTHVITMTKKTYKMLIEKTY